MATAPKLTAPKNGQHVTSAQHEGVFEIVFATALMHTPCHDLRDGRWPLLRHAALLGGGERGLNARDVPPSPVFLPREA
jgi:hypothetical protein